MAIGTPTDKFPYCFLYAFHISPVWPQPPEQAMTEIATRVQYGIGSDRRADGKPAIACAERYQDSDELDGNE